MSKNSYKPVYFDVRSTKATSTEEKRSVAAGLFPTFADVLFYREQQTLPEWAQKLCAPRSYPIDLVINAHAGVELSSGELAALDLLAIAREVRARCRTELSLSRLFVAQIKHKPPYEGNPERRAAFARKWARRLERGAA